MYKYPLQIFVFFVFLLVGNSLFSQQNLLGNIKNNSGENLIGATVELTNTSKIVITDSRGDFMFNDIRQDSCLLKVSFLGYKPFNIQIKKQDFKKEVNVTLYEDALNLNSVVVTGSFSPSTLISTATKTTVLSREKIEENFPRGTANLLSVIPGTFVDASAGEVFTRVYSRGISASAEDDMGWYYVSLQEDGLPVSLVQHSYYGPDLFHKVDLTTQRVEAVTGGTSSITALNAPGGIYNFISQGVHEELTGKIKLSSNLQGIDNHLYKIDGTVGGPMGNNWFFNIGGHYRKDQGSRNTDFTFSKGGQVKYSLIKKTEKGQFKFYGKILNDYTNRYTGVAAANWDNPQAAFGQDFNTTALLMPGFNGTIPDGRFLDSNKTNSFDPSQGVHAQDISFGLDINQKLGNDWSISNNLKLSNKIANWQTSISNAFVSISDPTAYYLVSNGDPFPVGQIVFSDAQSGQEIARLDNTPIFGGEPSTYIGAGSLPNDAIMGTSTWYKDNTSKEWMDQLAVRKKGEQHDINFGVNVGFAETSVFTQGSFGFVTYEPNPRLLEVTLENPGTPIEYLSDENGLSNLGGLFYMNARADVAQLAAFVSDRFAISDNLEFDLGVRWEIIRHKGSKDRFIPIDAVGGADRDLSTSYDNGVLVSTEIQDEFDFRYNYLSYSFGLNYAIEDNLALFTRFSKGNKAPELNYYFNNFANIPIPNKGEVQKIKQAEIGVNWSANDFSLKTTAFWSQLSDVGVSNFEFDGDTNSVFYTPIQLNTSNTIGLEWEAAYSPIKNISFTFGGTLQNAKATDWKIYDAAGSVATDDDTIIDYSGNHLPFNPNILFNLGTAYENKRIKTFLKWQFMGKREGNVANAFQLPSYNIFNFGLGYSITKNIAANILVTNLFNSEGLANFFGANSFGANANGVTESFIQDNPDASFVVVPVLPRATMIQLSYTF